jgi:glycosyltransferase involved in cell wall biosynthesis
MKASVVNLVVCAGGFAPTGGIEAFVADLMIGLKNRGLIGELVCWNRRSPLLQRIRAHGIPVKARHWRWGCRWGWPDLLILSSAKRAVMGADVVLFGKLLSPAVQRSLTKAKRGRGCPSFVYVTPYRPAEVLWPGARPTEVLDSFELIVTQTEGFRDELRDLGYKGEIRVLPYVPPPCREPVPVPEGHLRIGFLGRLVREKNVECLLRAFAELRSCREARLHLFGDGPDRQALQTLALKLGVAADTTFHGAIPPHRVPAAIDSCHLFAFTSRTEGQCLAALEILSRGRRLVAAPVGIFPELLTDFRFGVVLPGADPRAVVKGIWQVLQQNLAPEITQEAFARRYPREKVLDSYADLIRELALRGSVNHELAPRTGDAFSEISSLQTGASHSGSF